MRAILVDNEQLSLLYLKRLLERKVGGIEVVGAYFNAAEAIKGVKSLLPDVVFLDINMPEVNGLEVGEHIQMASRETEIVFVTDFDQYAVDVLELCALDYVMKPVQEEQLQKTMQRLRERIHTNQKQKQEAKQGLQIGCFQNINIQLPDQQPQIIKWRTAKALELFAFLLHNRNKFIDRNTLIELLWPDFEEEKSLGQLYTTIFLIRQTLKQSFLGEVSIDRSKLGKGYRLTIGSVRIDTEEWEARVKQLDELDSGNVDEYERVLEWYQGDYLGGYAYLWAEYERERLRRLWLQLARSVSNFYMEQRMWIAAIKVNYRIQELHPDEEYSYFQLMKLFAAVGNHVGVEEQYWTLCLRWKEELNAVVNEGITSWYEQWKLNTGQGK